MAPSVVGMAHMAFPTSPTSEEDLIAHCVKKVLSACLGEHKDQS